MNMSAATDESLLAHHLDTHDPSSFHTLVQRHAPWIHAAALRQLRDPHAADDATQAVFILLVQQAPRLRPHPNLAGWLFSATQYTVKAMQRARIRRQHHEYRAAADRPEAVSSPADALPTDRVDAAVARLPAADRTVLVLRYY